MNLYNGPVPSPTGTTNADATQDDIQRLIDIAATKNCKKLYLVLRSHGSSVDSDDPGLQFSSEGAEDGMIPYKTLMAMLEPFEGIEMCGLISACFSGQIGDWLQGRGFTGVFLTSADHDNSSWTTGAGGVMPLAILASPTGRFRGGTLQWNSLDGLNIQINGDQPHFGVNVQGTVDPSDCTFQADGDSGNQNIPGWTQVPVNYSGRLALSGSTSFQFRMTLGANLFPDRPIIYDADAQIQTTTEPPEPTRKDIDLFDADSKTFSQFGGAGSQPFFSISQGSWTASTDAPWITIVGDTSGVARGALKYTVAPNTGSQSRTGTITIGDNTVTIRQDGQSQKASVNSTLDAASFSAGTTSQGFGTATGVNLSDTTRTWSSSDFIALGNLREDGAGRPNQALFLPTSLDGTSVKVNGRSAFVSFINPNQVNFLVDDDPFVGMVDVEITGPRGESVAYRVFKHDVLPQFFRFNPEQGRFVAGVHPDGTLLGRENLFTTFVTRPAKPADIILLFGSGWGARTRRCPRRSWSRSRPRWPFLRSFASAAPMRGCSSAAW